MKLDDGTFTLKYHFVTDLRNGDKVVLPGKVLDQGSVFYTDDHEGHIACPDCEVAKIRRQLGFTQAGAIRVRDHFKVAHGEKHDPDCIKLSDQIEEGTSSDKWDLTKGPVIFLNELREPPIPAFNRSAGVVPRLTQRDADGKLHILNEDLDNRRRLRAKTPEDFFRIMKSKAINQALLQDAWVINSDHATPFPKFFIRPEANGEQVRIKGLVADLMGGRLNAHAVMLNTTLREAPSYKRKDGRTRLRFGLESFTMPHPETGKPLYVIPAVHLRVREAFHDFNGIGQSKGRGAAEIFILAHPYLTKKRGQDDVLFLHFEINDARHYAWRTLADLTRAVTKRPDFRTPVTP